MSFIDYEYDRTASLPANKLVDYEIPLVDRGIFCEHGAFWQDGLKVEGWTGGAWVELQAGIDYSYSPGFLTVSAESGRWAYSYLVYAGDLDTYTKVRMTCQLVGSREDRPLLDTIASELTGATRTYIYSWAKVATKYTAIEDHHIPNSTNKGLMSIISTSLNDIATMLATNQPHTDPNLLARLQAIETSLTSYEV